MDTQCFICKKNFSIKPSRIKRLKNNKISCSKQCSNKLKEIIYSGRNNPNTKYKNLDDNFFKIIDTDDKAYLLGWIASDGSIGKNNSICIAIHKKDKECLQNIKEIICNEIPIKIKNETIIYITINSKQIANDVCNHLNIKRGKKFDSVELPINNNKLTWSFIRGFFDGDGSIPSSSKKHKIRCNISSNSKKLLFQIEEFINLKSYNNKKDKIEIHGKNALIFLEKLYENSKENTRLKRKYDSYQNLLSIFS